MAIERMRLGNRSTNRQYRVCNSCNVVEDEIHVIQFCPQFNDLRQNVGPVETLVERCLLGSSVEVATFLYKVLRRIDLRFVH